MCIFSAGVIPEGGFNLELDLPDCRGVATNWHFYAAVSEQLAEAYVSCVTDDMPPEFVIKRIDVTDFSVTEIPLLAAGVPAVSPIFAYLHIASCWSPAGATIGTLIPGVPAGSTTFFAAFIDATGTLQGTDQVVLPGARANHQAFYCVPNDNLTTFVYHGSGATVSTTDTFVLEVQGTAITEAPEGTAPIAVHRVTENRETDWADAFPRRIEQTGGGAIEVIYHGHHPVAEVDYNLTAAEGAAGVRYGGIDVPIFFADFEVGNLSFWSTSVGGPP